MTPGNRTVAARIVAAALASLVLAAAAASAGTPAKFRNTGAFIEIFGSDAAGCVWYHVTAMRGSSGAQARETFLAYDIFDQCSFQSIASGFGTIPNRDFTVSRTQARLQTSPVASSTFTTWGPTGSIRLSLTRTRLVSYSSTGQTHYRLADGMAVHWSGTYTYASAATSGVVFDVPADGAEGYIGKSRDRTVEIQHK